MSLIHNVKVAMHHMLWYYNHYDKMSSNIFKNICMCLKLFIVKLNFSLNPLSFYETQKSPTLYYISSYATQTKISFIWESNPFTPFQRQS